MMHFKNITAKRPIEIPILLSAMGPKGQKLTEEHADGIFTIGGGQFDLDWHVQMVNGTVLDDGETLESDRVKQAVGPWYVLMYHAGYYHAPDSVNDLPAGPQWREALEAERPAAERHLIVHEGHVTELTDRDPDSGGQRRRHAGRHGLGGQRSRDQRQGASRSRCWRDGNPLHSSRPRPGAGAGSVRQGCHWLARAPSASAGVQPLPARANSLQQQSGGH